MNNSTHNYIIKISCTSKDELSCNNKEISIKYYNKLNLKKLIDTTDYIEKALILYKKIQNKNFTTKSLEFICKCCNNEFIIDLKPFIKEMQDIGYSSSNNTFIYLIKINNNDLDTRYEPILKYRFQSITEVSLKENIERSKNKSSYHAQILYTKTKQLK